MSGSQLGAGAAANPNAYGNMAAMGTPVPPDMSTQMGVPPYNPGARPSPDPLSRPGFDLKSPLAGFAMQLAMQHLAPKGGQQMQLPRHMMGLQPGGQIRNPYGPRGG